MNIWYTTKPPSSKGVTYIPEKTDQNCEISSPSCKLTLPTLIHGLLSSRNQALRLPLHKRFPLLELIYMHHLGRCVSLSGKLVAQPFWSKILVLKSSSFGWGCVAHLDVHTQEIRQKYTPAPAPRNVFNLQVQCSRLVTTLPGWVFVFKKHWESSTKSLTCRCCGDF